MRSKYLPPPLYQNLGMWSSPIKLYLQIQINRKLEKMFLFFSFFFFCLFLFLNLSFFYFSCNNPSKTSSLVNWNIFLQSWSPKFFFLSFKENWKKKKRGQSITQVVHLLCASTYCSCWKGVNLRQGLVTCQPCQNSPSKLQATEAFPIFKSSRITFLWTKEHDRFSVTLLSRRTIMTQEGLQGS